MPTDAKLAAAELAAGVKALTALLDANLPFFQRAMVSDDMIRQCVAAVLKASDDVRNKGS